MDVSIVIVSWNCRDRLKENLDNLFKSRNEIKKEVFVVDNNSEDGTAEMVNKNFEQVNLIANSENLGFSKANNMAIKETRGRYILLLNPDMRVYPDTLKNMVEWMDKIPEAGVAGCHLVNEKGATVPHVRRFPRLTDQLAVTFKIPHIFPSVLNRYLQKDFDYTKEAEVDSIRGSFFMIRRETLREVGKLDERFFVWFEEVDYCQRVWRSGWKVMYTPVARCLDYVGQSFALVKRKTAQRYFRDSMLQYFLKWHPKWQYWILKTAWTPVMFLLKSK